MDFYEDLEIDDYNLDENIIKQPMINMQYCELWANENEKLNDQKLKVKVSDAELKEIYGKLYLEYKQKDFDGKRPSEKTIESQILTDSIYKKKQKEYFNKCEKLNKIQKQLDLLDGAVKSFQQRKNALEKRIELWINSYHSTPKQKAGEGIRTKLRNRNG